MEYLADPETELLDDDQELKIPDLEGLLEEGGGSVKETIDLCEYLNDAGKRYTGVPDLTAHLKDAHPLRKRCKEQIGQVLYTAKKTPLKESVDVSDKDIDKLYDLGECGPKSAALVRDLGWAAKDSKDKVFDSIDAMGAALKERGEEYRRNRKIEKMGLRDYLNSEGCPAFVPGWGVTSATVTTGDVNTLYRIEGSGPGTIALLNSLEAQKKKFEDYPSLLAACKQTSAIRRAELAQMLSYSKVSVIPKPLKGATGTSHEIIRIAEESYSGPAAPYHTRELTSKGVRVDDSDELIPLIRKLHYSKKDAPVGGLSVEEGIHGLGEGSAGRIVNQKLKEKDARILEDVEALMEYLASEECLMMNECKELEPEELKHLLNAGHSLKETLNLCKYLNFRCHHFDTVPDLTEAIKEARLHTFTTKRTLKEMISSTMNHILPGWGEHILTHEVDFIFDECNCGLAILSYLRELVDGRKEFRTKEALVEQVKEMHQAAVAKRLVDVANIRDWLRGRHGEKCKLWATSIQASVDPTVRQTRTLFRIEGSNYGTAALLRAMQMHGKKTYDSVPAFLEGARAFSAEKHNEIFKMFVEKQGDIFRPPPGKKITVTLEGVAQLCEEIGRAVQQECRDRSRMPSSA
eukprot:TRINITY_DN11249_c0_g2_i4.p1 TRINITY_DN11249_c0_g2~~TRINITY_DN11249_c0_g2_i4.p1  ORF type:complete len:633 (+),score=124.33 TRINITY_DN11249_c0_g2_i4:88-1986(+)